jgi:hypothetical protein
MTSPKEFLFCGFDQSKFSLSDPHRSVIEGNFSAQFVVLPMSALGGGFNRSTQHFNLEVKDGV